MKEHLEGCLGVLLSSSAQINEDHLFGEAVTLKTWRPISMSVM